jgi:hypothetical protein
MNVRDDTTQYLPKWAVSMARTFNVVVDTDLY